jgi:hypothetical protein
MPENYRTCRQRRGLFQPRNVSNGRRRSSYKPFLRPRFSWLPRLFLFSACAAAVILDERVLSSSVPLFPEHSLLSLFESAQISPSCASPSKLISGMHPPDFRLDHRLSDWPDCYLGGGMNCFQKTTDAVSGQFCPGCASFCN